MASHAEGSGKGEGGCQSLLEGRGTLIFHQLPISCWGLVPGIVLKPLKAGQKQAYWPLIKYNAPSSRPK